MKALVYHGNKDIRLQTILDPEPGPDQLKLKVDFCGICATDIEEYLFGPKFITHESPNPITGKKLPLVIGHEISCTVVEVGVDVEDFRIGDRVVLDTILSCKSCSRCLNGDSNLCMNQAVAGFALDGGLAEYIVWNASMAIKLPSHVKTEHAALLEPSAVAHHAVLRCGLSIGDTLTIFGVGTVGILALQIAKAYGFKVVAVDRREMCLELAAQLGADGTVNIDRYDPYELLQKYTQGNGPDAVLDAAGAADTPILAVNCVKSGGTVVLVGIYTETSTFDFNSVVSSEVNLKGSIAYTPEDLKRVVDLLSKQKLTTKPLISGYISLDEVVDSGFVQMMAPQKDVFRLLVQPSA